MPDGPAYPSLPVNATIACPSCGRALQATELACPQCAGLVHRQQLEHLSALAMSLEPQNPRAAANTWRQCLMLLPPNSGQAQSIQARLATLERGLIPPPPPAPPPLPQAGTAPSRRSGAPQPSLASAIGLTVVSMLISIAVYAQRRGVPFATGCVIAILIHELGHTIACRWYRLRAGPPIFIPYVGALISLREPPKNATMEAVIGIAGPVGGAVATIICLAWYLVDHSPLAARLTEFSAFINLFNLIIPFSPIDGGRVARGAAPGVWAIAAACAAAMYAIADKLGIQKDQLMLALGIFAAGILNTLRQRRGPYFKTPPTQQWAIGLSYLALIVGLIAIWVNVKAAAYAAGGFF